MHENALGQMFAFYSLIYSEIINEFIGFQVFEFLQFQNKFLNEFLILSKLLNFNFLHDI